MGNSGDRIKLLHEVLDQRIVVLGGPMGTMIQQRNLSAADFGGPALEGCNENLVLTRPDVILDIDRQYLAAGSDFIGTDTFGATPLVLAEYGLADKCFEINATAAKLARQAAAEFSTPKKPRFVNAFIGPTTKAITVTGGVTFEQLVGHFHQQALGLIEGGVDILLVETCQDTRNVKAALIAIQQAFDKLGVKLPIMVSGTIEPTGTMLAGQAADAFVASLQHVDLLSIGLNCATGPEFMTDHIRTIHQMANTRVSCYPNAGLPNEEGLYLETPTSLASSLERFVKNGWLNIVGGCCGTTPAHVKAIAQMVEGKAPRRFRAPRKSYYTGIELVEATDDNRPLLVGERTNEVGSRAFKKLITDEKFEEATEIARAQVKSGAHIIDINLENTDRDELADIDRFYEKVIHKVKVPLMIDSTNPRAVERALTYCLGKSIINSINFEDGEEKFHKVLPLLKKYGAAVVIGSIDEDKQQAQAITRERKLAIARRAHKYCTEHGIPEEDLIFDALVFPCATGDENYIGSAVETIEGVRLIKEKLPRCKTVLGVSNVSFGLPPAAREVINSVFLYHCDQSRARSCHRQRREAGAVRHHPRRGKETRRGFAMESSTRRIRCAARLSSADEGTAGRDQPASHRRCQRAFPHRRKPREEEDVRPASRRPPRQLHPRRHEGRPDRRPRSEAQGRRRAARHHQRPAHERDEGGRAPVQRQRVDRRRSAAVRRGDEGRRRASRTTSWRRKPIRPRARSSSPPSKATCTTSARTSSRSFSRTTVTRSSTSASKCRRRN